MFQINECGDAQPAYEQFLVFGHELKEHRYLKERNLSLSHNYLLLASAYEMQENKLNAIHYYKQALFKDCSCYEAFDKLVTNNLLRDEEKQDLINQLSFQPHNLWLKDFYVSKINKEVVSKNKAEGRVRLEVNEETNSSIHIQFNNENHFGVSPIRINCMFESDNQIESLRAPLEADRSKPHLISKFTAVSSVIDLMCKAESNEIKFLRAEQLFSEQKFGKAHEIVKEIIDEDPFFVEVVPIFCSILIELDKQGELYYLAHKLVSANPDSAIAWYAVGSYYFLIRKYP